MKWETHGRSPGSPPWLWSVAGIHSNGSACQETCDERGNPKDPVGREVGELVNIVWFVRSRELLECILLKPAQSMQLPPNLHNHHPVLGNVLHVGLSYMLVALLGDSWYYDSRDRDVMVELCGSHYQYFFFWILFSEIFVVATCVHAHVFRPVQATCIWRSENDLRVSSIYHTMAHDQTQVISLGSTYVWTHAGEINKSKETFAYVFNLQCEFWMQPASWRSSLLIY